MNNYDFFAPFYDEVMGDRSDVIGIIERELTRHDTPIKTILEVACGTGSVLVGLDSKYDVSGLDQSAEMLKIAQRKLPNSSFYQAEMSKFKLNKKFDAVINIFDSINHLPSISAWEQTFVMTHAHLNPGGLFIFDFITTGRIKALIAMGDLVQEVAGATIEIALLKSAAGAVRWHLTIQAEQHDGTIQVYEDDAIERSYSIDKIWAALANKFEKISTFDLDGNAPTNSSDRVFVVAKAR